MEPLRCFKFRRVPNWRCQILFYENHIEYIWDKGGFGIEKGSRTVLRDQLQSTITSTSAFGYLARGSFYRAAQFLVVALALWLLVPGSWKALAWIFVALTLLPLSVAIARLKKSNWLNLQTKDGLTVISIDVTRWASFEISEFKDYFANWIKEITPSPQTLDNP